MVNKDIHCGRLMVKKDGKVKKLDLCDGGGIRTTTWDHIDLDFDELHERLRKTYNIDKTNLQSSLYDFQQAPLDVNRYRTFLEYKQQNGLKFRGTLLYLCTSIHNVPATTAPVTERRPSVVIEQPVHRTRSSTKEVAAVEADSSTSAVLIKVEPDRQPTTESSLNHSFAKNLQMSSSRSFESLSFEKLLNDFVSYFRDLLDNRSREPVLIEFFGSICTLRGLASIVLDRLKRDIETSDTKQHSLYAEGLEKIDKVTRSVQVLLELNKMKMHSYPILLNSFAQFQKNFKILHDKWTNQREETRPSTASSSATRPSEPTSSSNARVSSPSTSSRYVRENTSRKQPRALSPSPRRSSSANHNRERPALFEPILKSLDELLYELSSQSSFYRTVTSIIEEIKLFQSHRNLSDDRSLTDAEKMVTSIDRHLKLKMDERHNGLSSYGVNRSLENAFERTLTTIGRLLAILHRSKSQPNGNKRPRTSRRPRPPRGPRLSRRMRASLRSRPSRRPTPPPPPPPLPALMEIDYREVKPVIGSHRRAAPAAKSDADDDQNSEASHSSLGDDELLQLARGAFEKNRKTTARRK